MQQRQWLLIAPWTQSHSLRVTPCACIILRRAVAESHARSCTTDGAGDAVHQPVGFHVPPSSCPNSTRSAPGASSSTGRPTAASQLRPHAQLQHPTATARSTGASQLQPTRLTLSTAASTSTTLTTDRNASGSATVPYPTADGAPLGEEQCHSHTQSGLGGAYTSMAHWLSAM